MLVVRGQKVYVLTEMTGVKSRATCVAVPEGRSCKSVVEASVGA